MARVRHLIRKHRRLIIILFQTAGFVATYLVAFLLRFDGALPSTQWGNFIQVVPALLAIKLAVFWRFNLFQGWWRYVSTADLFVLIRANVTASALLVLYVISFHGIKGYPRSVFFLDWGLCLLCLGGARFTIRAYREKIASRMTQDGLPVLVVGAGAAGQILIREMRQNPALNKIPVGFVDDDPEKAGQRFQGTAVLGPTTSLKEKVEQLGVKLVILAIPSATEEDIQRILLECRKCRVEVQILPGLRTLVKGRVMVNQLRKVGIEDLLGRSPVLLDSERIASDVAGQVVLVTGAGGSIGGEICRQVAALRPKTLVLLERSENNMYHIELELSERFPSLHIAPMIGDVQDRIRMSSIMSHFRPSIVYHAAAYKHVPMMEHNPLEAVKNNVLGTKSVAEVAAMYGAKKFVLISSDKAVRPTNVMGATKQAAELVLRAIEQAQTAFVAVRFGNVLWSSGSVAPWFEKQIAEGGPVTVTHPEAARYFMTIPEATGLVLQAGSMGRGGELFVLDMGQPVRIFDLAESMIRLSGLEPGEDIEIKFIGLRPGDKLYEDMLVDGMNMDRTDHEQIYIIRQEEVQDGLKRALDGLIVAALHGDIETAILGLQGIVEEYSPSNDLFLSLPSRGSESPHLSDVRG